MTPTYAETAMYPAASAAGNSACLYRQVGAAVCDKNGEILAVGWNDVPQFEGGLYVADQNDPTSEKDSPSSRANIEPMKVTANNSDAATKNVGEGSD